MPRRTKEERRSNRVASTAVQPYHRHALLQAIIARGFLPLSEARSLYMKLTGAQDAAGYADCIADINEELGFVQFEIRELLSPVDGERYVGFVNKVSDPAARLLTSRYSHEQLAYFGALVESIATASCPDGEDGKPCMPSEDAASLRYEPPQTQEPAQPTQELAAGKRLTSSQKAETLERLVADGWLAYMPAWPAITIGPRTLMELRQLLSELDLPESTREAWDQLF